MSAPTGSVPGASHVRRRGALLILAGACLVAGGAALLFWFIQKHPDYAKSVALPFFAGFALLLEGVVEVVTNKSWSEHPRWRRMLFIVLGTPATAAAVLGAFLLVSSYAGRG